MQFVTQVGFPVNFNIFSFSMEQMLRWQTNLTDWLYTVFLMVSAFTLHSVTQCKLNSVQLFSIDMCTCNSVNYVFLLDAGMVPNKQCTLYWLALVVHIYT